MKKHLILIIPLFYFTLIVAFGFYATSDKYDFKVTFLCQSIALIVMMAYGVYGAFYLNFGDKMYDSISSSFLKFTLGSVTKSEYAPYFKVLTILPLISLIIFSVIVLFFSGW